MKRFQENSPIVTLDSPSAIITFFLELSQEL